MSQRTNERASSRRYRANAQRQERATRARCSAVEHRRRVVILGIALTGLITLLPWSAAAELPPAVQADLYLVQTEAYIKEKDYAAAQEAMAKILELQEEHGLKLPDEFHFKHAQVLEWTGSHAEAIESLNRYLELVGRSGPTTGKRWNCCTRLRWRKRKRRNGRIRGTDFGTVRDVLRWWWCRRGVI